MLYPNFPTLNGGIIPCSGIPPIVFFSLRVCARKVGKNGEKQGKVGNRREAPKIQEIPSKTVVKIKDLGE